MRISDIVTIDGKGFNVLIPENGITRSFEIADSENAGRLRSGAMLRDIIGTYYNYTIVFDTNQLSESEYDELYEVVSAPVDSHTIVVPYGQTILTFEAYVTSGQDVLKKIGKSKRWTGLSLNFIAMKPQKTPY